MSFHSRYGWRGYIPLSISRPLLASNDAQPLGKLFAQIAFSSLLSFKKLGYKREYSHYSDWTDLTT